MFIVIEGCDGSGKSSLVASLAEALKERSLRVFTTCEPGKDGFGGKIRDLLLHGEDLAPYEEVFLFLANRAHHVRTILAPALASHDVVICDRYTDSTLALQGFGRRLPITPLLHMNDLATGCLHPDITIVLDVEPSAGLERINARTGTKVKDRLDSESLEYHKLVRVGFLSIALASPRHYVIDTMRLPEEGVLRSALSIIDQLKKDAEADRELP